MLEHIKQESELEMKDKCISILNNMLNEDGKNIGGLYTISFSKNSDSLHQWVTYAKQSGVAIELDKRKFSLVDFATQTLDDEFKKCDLAVIDMIYKDKAVKDFYSIIDKSIKEISDSDWKDKEKDICFNIIIRLYASYIKDSAFDEEAETRITVMPIMFAKQSKLINKINYFRMQSGVLRPYINVKICRKENREACLPLKSITIGPSGIQQTIFDSVVHRIKYGECKIYNYFKEDKNKFIENFVGYLFEAYCITKNVKVNFSIREINLDDNKNLYENIIETLDNISYTRKETNVNLEMKWFDDPLIKILINKWFEENISVLSDNEVKGVISEFTVENGDELNMKLAEINQNLYFSKEGIVIRKSKIPYIF